MINKDRLYGTFMEICRTDAESTRERLLADYLKGKLSELGFSLAEDETGEKIGGNTGNVFASIEGTGPGEPLLFSCHMDRVVPGVKVMPRTEGDYIVSDGTTVLGADDGAGLAAILEGMTTLREKKIPHPPIELVLTVAEELALMGSSLFDTGKIAARQGFVLDATGPVGEIVVQAPEQVKISGVFHGRGAHAGFAPEQGISAIQMAATAVTRMKLARIDEETTANIGTIHAAGPTNIVPDRCELQAEARSLDPGKLRIQVREMTEAMERSAEEYGGTVDITTVHCYPAYRLDNGSAPARRAADAATRIGVAVRFKSTGGGSDANIFNNRGIPTVVLSSGYEDPHTTKERIALDQLTLLAEWFVAIVVEPDSATAG